MNLLLEQEQRIFIETVRKFFEKEYPKEVMRRETEGDEALTRELWEKIARLGWVGMNFPEQYGGADMNLLETAFLCEEMGRSLFMSPYFVNYVACQLISAGENGGLKTEILPRVMGGELIVTLALAEPSHRYDPLGISTTARETNSGYVVNGTKLFVQYAGLADYAVCAARIGGDAGTEEGVALFLLDLKTTANLDIHRLRTIAKDHQYELILNNVEIPKERLISYDGWRHLSSVLNKGRVIKYAELAGRLEKALEMAVDYSHERTVQGGKPIGSFQALQHQLADVATEIDGAKYLVYQAAQSAGGDNELFHIMTACAWLEKIYWKNCLKIHECFGAIGFTDEFDLQFITRVAKAHHPLLGDEPYYEQQLKKILFQ